MLAETRGWLSERTSAHDDWAVADLLAAKERTGSQVSVVIPAKNEEATVGGVVTGVVGRLVREHPLVDEIVVIDSDSTDATAAVAASAGATVHAASQIRPDLGTHPGKGEAIWKSLHVTTGDLLVFVDADLRLWGPHFVTGLLGPLLADPEVLLVKGFYDRLLRRGGETASTEGGRVTELVARPVLDLWWPELAGVIQPLAGEWAARRSLMESLSVPTGYGVEIASLIDTFAAHGLDAIAQVDLGARAHEHQKDHDLAVMAAELLAVTSARCALVPEAHGTNPEGTATMTTRASTLQQYSRDGGWRERPVPLIQRPPAGPLRRPTEEAR